MPQFLMGNKKKKQQLSGIRSLRQHYIMKKDRSLDRRTVHRPALNTPFRTVAEDDLPPSALEKAVKLGYADEHHPFIDDNKGIVTRLVMTCSKTYAALFRKIKEVH